MAYIRSRVLRIRIRPNHRSWLVAAVRTAVSARSTAALFQGISLQPRRTLLGARTLILPARRARAAWLNFARCHGGSIRIDTIVLRPVAVSRNDVIIHRPRWISRAVKSDATTPSFSFITLPVPKTELMTFVFAYTAWPQIAQRTASGRKMDQLNDRAESQRPERQRRQKF
jgi:hypothetical protein